MTYEQTRKLQQAMLLIQDAIEQNVQSKYRAVWLSVAGDYCKQVADELEEK